MIIRFGNIDMIYGEISFIFTVIIIRFLKNSRTLQEQNSKISLINNYFVCHYLGNLTKWLDEVNLIIWIPTK